MYMCFLSHLLGLGCIDGVTFGEQLNVGRELHMGEGVTHGYKSETARNVQHMQQRVEHIHAEGGGIPGSTHISWGQRYVRTYYLAPGTTCLTPPPRPIHLIRVKHTNEQKAWRFFSSFFSTSHQPLYLYDTECCTEKSHNQVIVKLTPSSPLPVTKY